MAKIGREREEVEVAPWPEKEPKELPAPEKEPVKEPEKAPA